MGYTKDHCDLDAQTTPRGFAKRLGLGNLGLTVHILARGEGYDFYHNHREQEEVYFCLEGTADLLIDEGETPRRLTLARGDAVRVDANTLRALGNQSSERAVVLIAGACPHPYPAGIGHHDVIADVLKTVGHGTTGFQMPANFDDRSGTIGDEEC